MEKRSNILSNHPYELKYNDKKGRWYTRFKTDNGIVQRNRKTREELENLIVEFYEKDGRFEDEVQIYSFSKAHDRWLEVQEDYGKDPNTIYRYSYDWKRYFEGTEFSKTDISLITSQDIEMFMIERIKTLNLKRQAGVTLYGYINGVYYTAVMDRKIPKDDNPCDMVDRKRFSKFYNKSKKSQKQRVLSQEEISKLITSLNGEIMQYPIKLAPYGVRLALLTGMRTGEICGLRWCNITDDCIVVSESEKINQRTGEYYQSDTKTYKERTLPITEELRKFLDDIREYQRQYGMYDDYVISNNEKKLRTRSLTNYMYKLSLRIGFDISKNIHSIRRTFNSYMRQSGTTAIVAGSIIGNTAEVNDMHYTYDICDISTKHKLVTDAENKMLNGVSFCCT